MLSVRRWRPADPVAVPRPGHADVWIVALDGVPSDEAAPADLAPDEIARARRLRFEEDRHRFVASRLALRRILGGCLKTAPRAIVLGAGPFGKPALDAAAHGTEIRFNVAHSGALALAAVRLPGRFFTNAFTMTPVPEGDRGGRSGLKAVLFGKDTITPYHVRATFAYPFIYEPVVIGGQHYFEGADRDPINFGNLLTGVDTRDIKTVVLPL